MKKYRSLLFCGVCGLMMAMLLSGCIPMLLVQSKTDPEVEADMEGKWEDGWDSAWYSLDDDWSAKGHRWKVLDAGGEEVCVIEDEESIKAVDDLTSGGNDWKSAEAPEDAKVLYTYVFMQQKTLLAGQDPDAERDYEEIMQFTVCEDSNVLTMVILNDPLPNSVSEMINLEEILTIHAEAPADTVEALRNPQQFTE